jgi:hypothetical protein
MKNSKESKLNFEALFTQKDALENQFGCELQWLRLPDRDSSRVAIYLTGVDPLNEDNWIKIIDWMGDKIVRFRFTFGPLIKTLPA